MVNADYFTGLKAKISDAQSCDEIQEYANEASAAVTGALAEIGKQLEALAPILALLSPPSASPGAIVGYLTGLITGLVDPIVKPAFTYPSIITGLMAELANINTELTAKIAEFNVGSITPCSITMPSATPPTIPPALVSAIEAQNPPTP